MKQTLHIFFKDTRRFWPEIAISLAVTTAFAWTYPHLWRQNSQQVPADSLATQKLVMLSGILAVMLPITWWLLTVRVVHAESLVGSRQFWLTRPYEWKKLLAAKLLFLFAYIVVPILTAQCAILSAAGFHPASYAPGLLYNLGLLSVLLMLPVFAIATVTSNFARIAFAIIGIGLGAVTLLFAFLTTSGSVIAGSGGISISGFWAIPFIFALAGTAVVLQYAARRVWLSRLMLIAIPSTFVLLGSLHSENAVSAQIERDYPSITLARDAPIQLALLQDSNHQVTASPTSDVKQVQIEVPLRVSGVAAGYLMMPDNVEVSLVASNGIHWKSQWQSIYGMHYLPGADDSHVTFNMPSAIFAKLKSTPVAILLTFAFSRAKISELERIPISSNEFSVESFGICSLQTGWDGQGQITSISCRSALRQPRLTYVETLWSNTPCSGAATTSNTGVQGAAWVGNLDTAPAELGIASVKIMPVPLSNNWRETRNLKQKNVPRFLCPGTTLTFTRYDLEQTIRTELRIPSFPMPADSKPRAPAGADD